MVRVSGRVVHGLVSQRREAVPMLQLPGVAHGRHGTASRAKRVVVIRSRTRGRAHGSGAGQQHGALVMMVTVRVGGESDD